MKHKKYLIIREHIGGREYLTAGGKWVRHEFLALRMAGEVNARLLAEMMNGQVHISHWPQDKVSIAPILA